MLRCYGNECNNNSDDSTESGKEYFIDDYNNGNFPFMPKKYKYLALAVGYAKERDTAIVEVTGYSFEPHLIRYNLYAFWTIAYHLGEVIEVHRKWFLCAYSALKQLNQVLYMRVHRRN